MKKTLLQILSLLFLLVLVSCSSVQITWDYDKDADFANLKTYEYYGWADNSDKILNVIDKTRIEKSFAAEFTKRGISYVKEGGDMVVALYIVTEQRQETTATTTGVGGIYGGYGYGGYYGYGPRWGWGTGMAQTTVSTTNYTDGTLIISVFDAKEQKLIWEGAASGTINEDPQKRDKNIPKVAAEVMQYYPVKPLPKEKK
ncbi:MAG TPA: DUF4136 domain-containing protein [Bacteroidales bacterium]